MRDRVMDLLFMMMFAALTTAVTALLVSAIGQYFKLWADDSFSVVVRYGGILVFLMAFLIVVIQVVARAAWYFRRR